MILNLGSLKPPAPTRKERPVEAAPGTIYIDEQGLAGPKVRRIGRARVS